jgi:nicotinamide mononucleotide transporter
VWIEAAVVILNLLYVVLMARGLRIGWWAGIAGSVLFVSANLGQHLYMDALLNSYYVLAGVYGWLLWTDSGSTALASVTNINLRQLIVLLTMSAILIAGLGLVLNRYTDNSLPYLDSCVTILSFLATWMAAKRYIENWFIWLIADPLAILLYIGKGGWFYPFLFLVYSIMAVYGYYQWKKDLIQNA